MLLGASTSDSRGHFATYFSTNSLVTSQRKVIKRMIPLSRALCCWKNQENTKLFPLSAYLNSLRSTNTYSVWDLGHFNQMQHLFLPPQDKVCCCPHQIQVVHRKLTLINNACGCLDRYRRWPTGLSSPVLTKQINTTDRPAKQSHHCKVSWTPRWRLRCTGMLQVNTLCSCFVILAPPSSPLSTQEKKDAVWNKSKKRIEIIVHVRAGRQPDPVSL